uniref:glycoside hydrolase family 2 TIM barrel-domain containing protein n=1 Tax=Demequina pelophila TaxID=1638984 RepID=UPI0007820881
WLLSLNGTWSFRWSPDARTASTEFADPAVSVEGWDTVEVPHHWQLDGYGDEETGGIVYLDTVYPWDGYGEVAPPALPDQGLSVGSYRREVEVPATWGGRRTILAFQGVKSAFTVWVNGEEIGYSEDSFTPAEFDVTHALVPGANTIAVHVHRWSDGSWLENQDMIDLSGIFRDVELYSVPITHLDDHTVTTELGEDLARATVTAEAVVTRAVATDQQAEGTAADAAAAAAPGSDAAPGDTLRATLHSPDGEPVATAQVALASSPDTLTPSLELDVPDPRLWSAEDPALYTLVYEILDGDDVIETVAERIGLREFGIVDGLMTLNGMPLDIKGVNRHDTHPDVGQAMTEGQLREDLELMRRHNITAVRTAHYPAHPALYRLADELGMYVMSEANLESHDLRPFPGDAPEWTAAVLDRVESMYQRDKNHASVLWWSLGNEVGPGPVFAQAADWLREVDPGRLVHFQEDSSVADVDGVFYPYLSQIEERAAAGGDKPWLMTEYQIAMGNSLGGIAEFWEVIDSVPDLQGGFVWDWADQSIRLPIGQGVEGLPLDPALAPEDTYFSYGGDWGDYPHDGAFATNGLVLPDRTVQPELIDLAAVYAPVELVDADLLAGTVTLRNEHLFTDLAALDASWALEVGGIAVDGGVLDVALPAGETGDIAVPVERPAGLAAGSEAWVTVSFALAEDAAWAPAGHRVAAIQAAVPWAVEGADAGDDAAAGNGAEVAGGEGTSDAEATTGAEATTEAAIASVPLEVTETAAAIEVAGDGFSVAIDRATGEISSFAAHGRELLTGGPALDFWRAPTQNDLYNRLADDASRWREASPEPLAVEVTRTGADAVTVEVDGGLAGVGDRAYSVAYTVTAAGDVLVEAALSDSNRDGEIPAVGMRMTLPGELDQVAWFGLGPHETWSDRSAGALVGRWSLGVEDMFFPYVQPQATGSRTDVRWMALTDESGAGLVVSALEDTFAATALPFSEAAIEAARHPHDLVADGETHLTIDGAQQGLGVGWGERALPQYTVAADAAQSVGFVLRALEAGEDPAQVAWSGEGS